MELTNKMIKTIFIISIILLVLDYVYISLLSKHFKYQIYIVQNKPLNMNIGPAIMCYILLIFGLYYFIIKDNKPLVDAFLLGILVYGVYELVTISLLSEWKWKTVIIDTIWGGILFTTTTYFTRLLIR
uniref:DUF2177 family protein n=1 Tax=viral metagenome TaxID=1070528 RepID=A0A6C0I618_9ZZZZ